MAPKQNTKTQTGSKNSLKVAAPARSTRSTSRTPGPILPTPAASTRATKSRSATAPPPSRKRKATEDIPIPSVETSERNDPIPKRATKRVKKEQSTAPSKPRPVPKKQGKAPVSADSLWGNEAKPIEHVGNCYPPEASAMDAALAKSREAAFEMLLKYEYAKRRTRGKSTLASFLRRRVPTGPRWEYIAASAPSGDTGAVDSANILEGARRARKTPAGTAKPSRKRKAAASVDASSLPAVAGPSKRQRREQSAVVADEETEEAQEEIIIPPIVERTPSPYPREEREPSLGESGGGHDGLDGPASVTTIWWEGVEYRDFRRDNPMTGAEEQCWVRVRR